MTNFESHQVQAIFGLAAGIAMTHLWNQRKIKTLRHELVLTRLTLTAAANFINDAPDNPDKAVEALNVDLAFVRQIR